MEQINKNHRAEGIDEPDEYVIQLPEPLELLAQLPSATAALAFRETDGFLEKAAGLFVEAVRRKLEHGRRHFPNAGGGQLDICQELIPRLGGQLGENPGHNTFAQVVRLALRPLGEAARQGLADTSAKLLFVFLVGLVVGGLPVAALLEPAVGGHEGVAPGVRLAAAEPARRHELRGEGHQA
jgi:hypothetical protein